MLLGMYLLSMILLKLLHFLWLIVVSFTCAAPGTGRNYTLFFCSQLLLYGRQQGVTFSLVNVSMKMFKMLFILRVMHYIVLVKGDMMYQRNKRANWGKGSFVSCHLAPLHEYPQKITFLHELMHLSLKTWQGKEGFHGVMSRLWSLYLHIPDVFMSVSVL